MAEFNQALQAVEVDTRAFNADIAAFNQRTDAANTRSGEFNTGCAQRAYRPSDLERLPPDLVLAINNVSVPSDLPLEEEAGR